ncbi:MAG: hypothetical protein JWQ09_1529 [Segetibacter sp.]|nr:hypothetical protein [Segetibacter sp.]
MNIGVQERLKNKIKDELKSFIISFPNIFSDNIIDIFFKSLLFELSEPQLKLDGLQTRVINAMAKILLEDLSKDEILAHFPDFVKIEPYLKKILFLVQPTIYTSLSNQNKGLAAYLNASNLNSNNIRFDTATPQSVSNLPDFASHVFRVYNLRNIESHNCESWSRKEIYENIESTLIVYIFSTYKHVAQLRPIVGREPDLTTYLNKVVADFELWQKRFVHITGKEKFEEIDILAIESDDWSENTKTILREGRIDDLRRNILEKTMVVLGEPGMGKSTTLQYIAYNDARLLLTTAGTGQQMSNIPIYVELKLLSKSETIFQNAVNRIGLNPEKLIEYFIKGRVTLFLDGLNEVLNELRKPVRLDIQSLITTYPNLNLIITSRPLAYSNEFKTSPVFVLQRMENAQVEEFLLKNCSHIPTRAIIVKELESNPKLGKIVRVPLLLKMLINVIWTNKGVIPSNKVQIIKKFIQNLYEREKKKMTIDVDLRVIHRLLCFLGFKTRELYGSNVGCIIEEFEAVIEERIANSRFNISVYEFFDFAIDLNILVVDGNKFSFIHELYQEYFASEEVFRLMAIKK